MELESRLAASSNAVKDLNVISAGRQLRHCGREARCGWGSSDNEVNKKADESWFLLFTSRKVKTELVCCRARFGSNSRPSITPRCC